MSVSRRSFLGSSAAVAALSAPSLVNYVATSTPLATRRPLALTDADADRIAVVASPERFSGIDPTGGSDSTSGLQAAVNSCPDGGLVIVPAGTYLLASPLTPETTKSIRLQGYGAVLVATSSKSLLTARGEYEATVAVPALTNASRSFPTGISEITTTLTTASPTGWRAGDVIKIVSDDPIDGARTTDSRRGEFATVYSSSGTSVVLAGRVRDDYATNVRAAKISRRTVLFEGFELRTADDRLDSINEPLISISRMYQPEVINIRVERAGGAVARLASCYGYLVEDMDVGYARDTPNESALGYGVLDNSSSFGRVSGGTFRHVRHAYTDDTFATAPGSDDLTNYGRTYGAVVDGVHAISTTAAGFSTHHSSELVTFVGCTTTGGVPGGGSVAGFELRGKHHRVVGCNAVNTSNGVLIRTESAGGESWGHTVSDFRASGMTNAALRLDIHPTGHPSAKSRDSRTNVLADNVTSTDSQRLVYAENARFGVSNSVYTAPAGVADQLLEGLFVRNSDVLVRDVTLDYRGNSQGRPRPVITGGSAGFVPGGQITNIDGLTVLADPAIASRAYFVFGGVENRITGRRIHLTHAFPRTPGESAAESVLEWSSDFSADGQGLSSSTWAGKSTSFPATFGELLKCGDKVLTILLNTEGKTLTMPALPAGRILGQIWHFHQTSSGALTFVNGASQRTSLKASANRVLFGGRSLQLIWDGNLWRETAAL